ncbi:gamma-glutamyltransferase [Novosphingobium profundi]|uniref:gamma-glutamyltransferase n=1 Tax=Novosphingobium profundi TaxID=1774954 RepID=UPI001BDB28F1|nr:gamma-glutamyltransferase [Novosphingobium profundi]MBT0668903.1 gamma-glutamyltransferase [Novosphingobium profundi]
MFRSSLIGLRASLALTATTALAACAAPVATMPPPGGGMASSAQARDATGTGLVSAADPRAAAAGIAILNQGGSSTDAAIATMLALNVVEPQNSGIGGGLFWLRHGADDHSIATIDGRETAPAAADGNWFVGQDGKPLPPAQIYTGALSSGVPGALAAMAQAHRRWGKLPWAALFQPAIALARDGFVVTDRLHNGLKLYSQHVTGWAKDTYFPGGQPVAVGTTLKTPALAETFERLASQGPEPFYKGDIAKDIVEALNTAKPLSSPITTADLAAYQAKERAAVCDSYRGYKVCSMGPPSSGGLTVLMILKQLERFDMKALGKDSPVAWHLLAESERLAYADRNLYMGDPDFVGVPVKGLLDPAYLARRSALIQPDRTIAVIEPGTPDGAPERQRVPFRDDPGTSDLAVVDKQGNVSQVTTTINGYFGSGISTHGFMLNNELPDFDPVPSQDGYLVANRVAGGKRPRSSMAPTIVYNPDGTVRLAVGAAGGATIICQIAKAIVGVIDWDLSAQDAIALGLIYAPGSKVASLEEGTELAAMVPALEKLGESVKVVPLGLKANAVEKVGGRWIGAADPRSEGVGMDTLGNVTVIKRRKNSLNGAHE